MLFAVIDEKDKESFPEHETQLSSIRWHLSEGVLAVSYLVYAVVENAISVQGAHA